MFKDNKRYTTTDTLIGQGTLVEGKLICESGIRIEGEYRGDIECKGDIIVGECGVAKSHLCGRDITLAGVVYGEIKTHGRLTITATGQLHGNVTASSLMIQDGGILNGQCRMEKAPPVKNRSALTPEPAEAREEPAKDVKDTKNSKDAKDAKSRQVS